MQYASEHSYAHVREKLRRKSPQGSPSESTLSKAKVDKLTFLVRAFHRISRCARFRQPKISWRSRGAPRSTNYTNLTDITSQRRTPRERFYLGTKSRALSTRKRIEARDYRYIDKSFRSSWVIRKCETRGGTSESFVIFLSFVIFRLTGTRTKAGSLFVFYERYNGHE